jgi:hypothetical protein
MKQPHFVSGRWKLSTNCDVCSYKGIRISR